MSIEIKLTEASPIAWIIVTILLVIIITNERIKNNIIEISVLVLLLGMFIISLFSKDTLGCILLGLLSVKSLFNLAIWNWKK